MLELAGQLFIMGGPVNMMEVNNDLNPDSPAVVVDLPNFVWNHSTKYWVVSEESKDWRFRRFVHHDLLGSKVLGTPWVNPVFKKTLRVQDLPWLKDHRVRGYDLKTSGVVANSFFASTSLERASYFQRLAT